LNKATKIGSCTYFKECLRDGYFSLLVQKPADSISISEIEKLVGVSRMSFYRYYQDKEALVQQYLTGSFNDFMNPNWQLTVSKIFKMKT